jgi:pilus assembly protein CpaF
MNTGHDGGLCTVHANSPRDALSRLETMVLMAGTELPSRAVREQIASAIQLIVHVRRFDDGVRRIESIAELTGMEGLTPLLQDLFVFRRTGRDGRRIRGHFAATGIVPRVAEELRDQGLPVDVSIFKPSRESASS